MRTTAHFHISVFIIGLFYLFEDYSTWGLFLTFVASSVLIDLDILISPFIKEKNHRLYFTHSIIIWLVLSIIFAGLSITSIKIFDYFLFFCLGIVMHLSLDFIDWGLPLFPSKKENKIYLGILNDEEITDFSMGYFIKKYWKSKTIITIEIILLILSVLGWIVGPLEFRIGIGVIGVFVYSYFIYEMIVFFKERKST